MKRYELPGRAHYQAGRGGENRSVYVSGTSRPRSCGPQCRCFLNRHRHIRFADWPAALPWFFEYSHHPGTTFNRPCSPFLSSPGCSRSASSNTLRLTIRIRISDFIFGRSGSPRFRNAYPLIFLFTPRCLVRHRLDLTRPSRTSLRTAQWNAFLCRGGNNRRNGQFAANDPHGMRERDPVGVLIGIEGRFVD